MSAEPVETIKIVVAIDGSRIALRALSVALDLARHLRNPVDIHVAAVVDYSIPPAGLGKSPAAAPDILATEAETALAVAEELASTHRQSIAPHELRGAVVDEVLNLAHRVEASYIVVGTHGRKGIQRAVMGSTCEGLIRRSDVPVLTVRKA